MGDFLLGLISDTHGRLRPQAVSALQGCQAIIHAGDVGDPAILDELQSIAPVHAVRGNVDTEPWAASLPKSAAFQLQDASIYVLHSLKDLDLNPKTAGFHIVVSGHTHSPISNQRDGVLYINPGSAGPRRFHLPVMLARLALHRRPWIVDFVELI